MNYAAETGEFLSRPEDRDRRTSDCFLGAHGFFFPKDSAFPELTCLASFERRREKKERVRLFF